jgi:hypothetical protein
MLTDAGSDLEARIQLERIPCVVRNRRADDLDGRPVVEVLLSEPAISLRSDPS